MESLNIIFMGTPEYSVPYLEALIQSNMAPVAVITQPDKPSGRKGTLEAPPVKQYAVSHGVSVMQPDSVNTPESIEQIRTLHPDLIVLVAFGQIISKEILDLPRLGCINVHPSLLPKYRGPSPRQAPIMNGDTQTGVTIMLMDEKMDHGQILSQVAIPIDTRETYETLCTKTITIGVPLLINTIHEWINGAITPQDQDHSLATYTRLFKKESGRIDWSKSATEIDAMVRALNPWPGTWTQWRGKRIKILETQPGDITAQNTEVKDIFFANGERLYAECGTGKSLEIIKLQVEGKNAVAGTAFIHGYLS